MAITDLIARIEGDATAEAAEILAAARAEAAAIVERAQAAADAERTALLAQAEHDAAEEEATVLANARLASRDALLAAKRVRAERVLERAQEALESLPDAEYLELIAAGVAEASVGGETVLVAPGDRDRLAGIAPRLEQLGAVVRVTADPAPIERGALLAGDRVRVEVSPAAMIADARDELLLAASRALFDGEE